MVFWFCFFLEKAELLLSCVTENPGLILYCWLTFNANQTVSYVIAFLDFSKPLPLLPCVCFAEIMQETYMKGNQIQSTRYELYVLIEYNLCKHTQWLLKIIPKDCGEYIHLTFIPFQNLMTLKISFSWKYFHENILKLLILFILLNFCILFCFLFYALGQEAILHWVIPADSLALNLSHTFPW